jgi:SecD/SecF fusion protein
MKKNLWVKILVILGITAFFAVMAYPPDQKIRRGKDLQGGVSVTMQVRIDDTDNWETVMSQVITVIKQRVNPTGVLDISVQAQGRDRIEIVMPLPSSDVLEARAHYESLLAEIVAKARIPSAELSQALREGTAVERFGGEAAEGGTRVAQLTRLQLVHDELQQDRAALEAVEGQEIDAVQLARLQQAVADAEYDFELQLEQTLRMSLDERRLVQAVMRSTEPEPQIDATGKPVIDPVTEKEVKGPSPREVEVSRLKSEFPNAADEIDALIAAYDQYTKIRKGLDDPEDLLRLLRGAGVLDFHIAVRPSTAAGVNINQLRAQLLERGPTGVESNIARWFPINDLKQFYEKPVHLESLRADPVAYFDARDLAGAEYDGKYYLLLYTTDAKAITHQPGEKWSVVNTFRTTDDFGRTAVGFRLDDAGGNRMSALTGRHVGEPMAIVLDGEVYTAPTLDGQIGKQGVITGSFSEQDLTYLIRVLAAGSLEARLSPEPIAINTLGPSVGADNLNRGLEACLYSVIVVAIFMLAYYFFAGLVANIALLINAIIIFGVMAMMDATFTLPGLAGVALTIGMAVDANVLIYERIREELFAGEKDLRIAIKLGYSKALSTIVDGNLTNLIVCVVLINTATTEVQGFARTLMIGIVASMFTALYVTRAIFAIYTDVFKARTLPMLATVVPAIHRALEPSINWIGLRKFCIPLSVVMVVASIAMVAARGNQIFDTEFRGGVSMSMRTTVLDEDNDGEPDALRNNQPARVLLSLAEVRDRVHMIGEEAATALEAMPADAQTESAEAVRLRILRELQRASVLTMGSAETRDNEIVSSEFQIKVANPSGIEEEATITDTIVGAIVEEFGRQLDITPAIEFDGAGVPQHTAYTFPVTDPELGKNINEPRYTERVNEYLGGVAVVLSDMDPSVTLRDLEHRIERMRGQPDFRDALGRRVQVIGLEPADTGDPSRGYRSAAVLVADDAINYLTGDPDRWDQQLAAREWQLVSAALQQPPALQSVSSFSSAVAETLAAGAVVAVVMSLLGILVYIWFRFGSLRYSAAAVVALMHDVCIALGLLAATQLFGDTAIARALLIEDFHIDLGVVAALLTIIGYSLNDTIVILDRIRENRGKLLTVSADVVNRSINQTFSRTILTGGTTIVATLILYIEGGTGIRPFTFCLLIGLLIGTYSSVAVAAPLVYKSGRDDQPNAEADLEARIGPVEDEVP